MNEDFLQNFDFKEELVELGIEKAILREKNSAPRYNPFYLLSGTPDLDAAIERDQIAQSMRKSLRSVE
jgi:hypothetical protein